MKLSVSSYSFSQYIKNGKLTQLSCVAKAKEMGFDGIEFTDLKPEGERNLENQLLYAAEIKAEAERVGIDIVAYTIGANLYKPTEEEREAEVERVKSQLDVAAVLGAKVFRHDVCYKEKVDGVLTSFDKMLPTIAAAAREISEYAKELGIVTCTENHGFIAQDSDRVEKLFNTVDCDNYGILVDMGNFACADEDSAKAVSRLAPYAVHVHAKDFKKRAFGEPDYAGEAYIVTRGCNKLCACAVGDGDIPVSQCVAILKRAGYDGYLSIEFEGLGDCITEIAKGREFLLNIIGE